MTITNNYNHAPRARSRSAPRFKMSEPLSMFCLTVYQSRLFLTGISHLQLIRDILRESNFDETKWPDLGLSLGLLQPQIKSVKQSCSNDPHDCLLECLSSWLKSENTRPQLLANALDSISTVAAERIRKICKL